MRLAGCFCTCLELMMENKLARKALPNPREIPSEYWLSNLKIMTIPQMIKTPVKISSGEIFLRPIRGSRIAVKRVSEERQTRPTEMVELLMDWKNNIQCPPTKAPVKNSFNKAIRGKEREVF